MMDLSNIAYNFCLLFIEVYKWIELQVLKLFSKQIARKGKELGEKIGIAFHFPDEVNGNGYESSWTQEDEQRVLAKCNHKYDKVLHIKVHKPEELFVRLANRGTLGNGEAFMDGLWDVGKSDEDISEMARRMLENNYQDLYYHPWNKFLMYLELYAFNLQTKKRAFQVGQEHYDLGNDLYELMLDPWMQYTCAYWAKAKNLNEAQEHKLELIAKKLDLKPGMRVLDIGCGFGMLCKYLAEKYNVECVGVTISEQQAQYGRKMNEGLPVDIRLQDYRDVNEKFDRVVSIGCLEHVGFKNYHEFFKVAHNCLKDDGIFLLHSIAVNHKRMLRSEPWLHKYIFPNGNLPFPKDITTETEGLFIIEDWHNFGPDYARTLRAWRDNFVRNWPHIESKYGNRFYRMWIMYLSLCVGVFTSRRGHLWQIVLSKDGLKTDYRAAR